MLIKDSFPLTYFFFMLPNTEKHRKLFSHKVYNRNKWSLYFFFSQGNTITMGSYRFYTVTINFTLYFFRQKFKKKKIKFLLILHPLSFNGGEPLVFTKKIWGL